MCMHTCVHMEGKMGENVLLMGLTVIAILIR